MHSDWKELEVVELAGRKLERQEFAIKSGGWISESERRKE